MRVRARTRPPGLSCDVVGIGILTIPRPSRRFRIRPTLVIPHPTSSETFHRDFEESTPSPLILLSPRESNPSLSALTSTRCFAVVGVSLDLKATVRRTHGAVTFSLPQTPDRHEELSYSVLFLPPRRFLGLVMNLICRPSRSGYPFIARRNATVCSSSVSNPDTSLATRNVKPRRMTPSFTVPPAQPWLSLRVSTK